MNFVLEAPWVELGKNLNADCVVYPGSRGTVAWVYRYQDRSESAWTISNTGEVKVTDKSIFLMATGRSGFSLSISFSFCLYLSLFVSLSLSFCHSFPLCLSLRLYPYLSLSLLLLVSISLSVSLSILFSLYSSLSMSPSP